MSSKKKTVKTKTTKKTAKKKSDKIVLRASQAATWQKCPGILTKTIPDISDSSNADEGTLIHALAEYLLCKLLGHEPGTELAHQVERVKTHPARDEYTDIVNYYLEIIQTYIYYTRGDSPVMVERSLRYKRENVTIQGTADLILIDHEHKIIRVFDLKTGYLPVEAEGNNQLTLYAHMLANELKLYDYEYQNIIVQPRPRTYSTSTPAQLSKNYLSTLAESMKEKIESRQKLHLSAGDHCRYCPAKLYCPELKKVFEYLQSPEFAGQIHNGTEVWADAVRYQKTFETMFKDAKRAMLAYYDLAQGMNKNELTDNIRVTHRNVKRAWLPGIELDQFARALKMPKSKISETKLQSPTQLLKNNKLTEKQQAVIDNHISMITSTSFELIDSDNEDDE